MRLPNASRAGWCTSKLRRDRRAKIGPSFFGSARPSQLRVNAMFGLRDRYRPFRFDMKRWLTRCFAVLVSVSLGLTWASGAIAQPLDSLQTEQQHVQQQIGENQAVTDQLERQENEAREQLRVLKDAVDTTDVLLADVEFRLERAKQRLVLLQKTLQRSLARLAAQKKGTIARLRILQRQRPDQWWALLLGSKDWNEFLDRRYYFKLLYASDRQRLQDYQDTAEQVRRDRVAAEAQKHEISLLVQELAQQKQELETQVTAQEDLIARIASQRVAYVAAQERLAADSARIAKLIRQLMKTRADMDLLPEDIELPDDIEGGAFRHPVIAPITSGFGWRIHPVFGSRRLHSGIDYGVATGTAVRAVERGTVIYSGWYGAYGNTTIVYHGNDLTTLYAHNSELAVPLGATVERGEIVAFSGSTGLSTGPHVHFEVRLRGNPINPVPFF